MTLFLVGGGPTEHLQPIFEAFITQVRPRGSRIAVALLGSQQEAAQYLDTYADPLLAYMPDAQIEPVWLTDESDEEPISWPDDVDELAGLVVGGGWTPGYLDALHPHRELLARLVRSGMPYLGYSAGAAVVAKHVIAAGWQQEGRQIVPEIAGEGTQELQLRDGLALIGPSVDPHADTHNILGRCIAALETGPMSSVVAIDERTALVIDAVSGRTRVLGPGRVTWVSRAGADFNIRFEKAR